VRRFIAAFLQAGQTATQIENLIDKKAALNRRAPKTDGSDQ
jgi:hypothetical protein